MKQKTIRSSKRSNDNHLNNQKPSRSSKPSKTLINSFSQNENPREASETQKPGRSSNLLKSIKKNKSIQFLKRKKSLAVEILDSISLVQKTIG